MSRALSGAMQTAVASLSGETVRLLELNFGGGTVRYTDGSSDLSWNGFTWTAIGGEFVFSPSPESADLNAASAEITLAAVSGSIAATIAAEQFVGRLANLYVAHIDPTTRAVVVDPLLTQRVYMSGGWEIVEGLDTITATVRCTSRVATLTEHRGIQCNIASHGQFYPDDVFFNQVSQQLVAGLTWGASYVRLR